MCSAVSARKCVLRDLAILLLGLYALVLSLFTNCIAETDRPTWSISMSAVHIQPHARLYISGNINCASHTFIQSIAFVRIQSNMYRCKQMNALTIFFFKYTIHKRAFDVRNTIYTRNSEQK